MTFTQRIQPNCDEHGDECIVIDCITSEPVRHHESGAVIHDAGTVVWRSCMNSAIHPEHRLNPDHPAEDHRGSTPAFASASEPCNSCLNHPAWRGV